MTNDTPKSKIEKTSIFSLSNKCEKKGDKIGDKTLTTKSIKKYKDEKTSNLYCKCCNYTAKTIGNMKKHYKTHKHQSHSMNVWNKKEWICNCGRGYSSRQNYYRHKKLCEHDNVGEKKASPRVIPSSGTSPDTGDSNITKLLKCVIEENKELRHMISKQQEQISDIIPRIGNTNNFNLHIFLNEQCKDAINISDFINSLEINVNDLEHTKKHGLSNSISNIVINKLNELGMYRRPIHCTDIKRETLYIKEDDSWEKDNDEHDKLKETFNGIIEKQSLIIKEWEKQHPEWNKTEKGKEEWIELVKTLMNDGGQCNDNRIIKVIAKEVKI